MESKVNMEGGKREIERERRMCKKLLVPFCILLQRQRLIGGVLGNYFCIEIFGLFLMSSGTHLFYLGRDIRN